MARVYSSTKHARVERGMYRVMGVDPDADQRWTTYLRSVLAFSLVGLLFLYGFQRVQEHLLLSLGFPAVKADQAWNTAASFLTNTNWQSYSGESTMGYLVQMAGLAVQNFVSAAVGIAVADRPDPRLHAVAHRPTRQLLGRPDPRLPAHPAAARRSCSRSCSSSAAQSRTCTAATTPSPRSPTATRPSPAARSPRRRPSRSSGTNGGGFYNANSSHPFENPTKWTNLLEIFLLLVDPVLAAAHVRQAGRRRAAGLRDRRGDGRRSGSCRSSA